LREPSQPSSGEIAKTTRELLGLPPTDATPIPDDPWEFCKQCVYTMDEHLAAHGGNPIRPLVSEGDDYLEYLTRRWQKGGCQQWKKSRQIRVTWLLAALHLWEALKLRGIRTGYQAKKFEDADSFLRERFWFIYERIPDEFDKPKARYVSGVIEVFHEGTSTVPTSQIVALAEGPNQVRQFTYSRLWRDEAAFHFDQKEAHGAAQPTLTGGGADLKTSSSGGSRTFFYQLAEEDVAPGPVTPKEQVFHGITHWQRNGYDHLFIHFSADPKKRPGTPEGEAWIAAAKQGQPTDLWRREMEGDDTIEPGTPVFCDTERLIVKAQEIRGWCPWLTGFDFGYQWPFCYVVQIESVNNDPKNLLVHVLHEFVKPNTEAYEFGMWVKTEREKLYGGHRQWHDFGDDASKQHSDKGVTADILQRIGITIESQPTGPGGIIKRVALIQRLISGNAIEFDPQCRYLITAIKSGYVRDEDGNPVGGTEGHPYADACDALGYCLVNTMDLEYQPMGTNRGPNMVHGSPLPSPPGQPQPAQAIAPAQPLTTCYRPTNTRPVKLAVHTSRMIVPTRYVPPSQRRGR